MSEAKRSYQMKARREQVAETRQRIVRAVVALHEEVGPRNTTVSAIAERAGVERLTVYRHFPDELAIFRACSAEWLAHHPPPSPAQWENLSDPEERFSAALTALVSYYRRSQAMLKQVYRDLDEIAPLREVSQGFATYLDGLAAGIVTSWKVKGPARRALAAVVTHSVRFSTWMAMEENGVKDADKVSLLVVWAAAVAARGR
jgi:AcrR family transcriptional regulator